MAPPARTAAEGENLSKLRPVCQTADVAHYCACDDQFFDAIKAIEDFWFSIVTLFSGEEFAWGEESIESPTNGTLVPDPLNKR
jgi:hypothetical protein